MSVVTNLIFTCDQDDCARMLKVNEYFKPTRGLVNCDAVEQRGWYGGTKMLEADIYIGAFNGLHLPDFLDHLRTISWQFPDTVQLIVKKEDDEQFRIITLEKQ